MNKLFSLLLLCVVSWSLWAQDERYFRQLFSGELNKKEEAAQARKYSYVLHTPYYSLDLNRDGKEEQVVFAKKENEDWIEIFDHEKKKIFSYRFENKGYDSELFRIELKTISPTTDILILYYYEGVSKYIDFQGTARIYAVTIDNKDLKTLSSFKAYSFFDEVKTFKGHYHKRFYQVVLEDLNGDGIKELIIKHRNTSNVFMYHGDGKWQTFKQAQQ